MLVGGAFIGCGIAVYLALYQLGVLTSVWEPFFGSGSRDVLHSKMARFLPFPDALFSAVGYLIESARLHRVPAYSQAHFTNPTLSTGCHSAVAMDRQRTHSRPQCAWLVSP